MSFIPTGRQGAASRQTTPWHYIRLTLPASELRPGDIIVRWYEGHDQEPCEERLWPVVGVSHYADTETTEVECRQWHVGEWKGNPVDLEAADQGGGVGFAKDELVDVLRAFNIEEVSTDAIARTSIRATEPWG